MGRAPVQTDQQCLEPVPHQGEKITGANLPVGRFKNSPKRPIVVMNGSRGLEQVAEGLFERIVHAHLSGCNG